MEEHILYAKHYSGMTNNYEGIENGEKWLNVYEGIYQRKSTVSDKMYPALKYLGSVNITTRTFYKSTKNFRKVIRQEGNNIILYNYHNMDSEYTYTPLTILFNELGHPNTLLNDITNIVITASNNPNIKVRDNNRIGWENHGIVPF